MQQLPSKYSDVEGEYTYRNSVRDSIKDKMLFNKEHRSTTYGAPMPDNPMNGPVWDRKSSEVTTGWRPFYSSYLGGFDKNK